MKLLWWLFFLITLLITWLLGYRMGMAEEKPTTRKLNIPKDYLAGLNFLLNEETDKAVDAFIKMLELDSDTVETHLAVAKLFRRRGEVDRAIRIHQNLIARPQLDKIYRDQSLYELGHDYLSAGMLDRAERIFQELIATKSYSSQALQKLIAIYQQEKNWEKAINAAMQYEIITQHKMSEQIAHYYCEMAELAFQQQHYDQAEEKLNKALKFDSTSVRATLIYAKVAMAQKNYKAAIAKLKKVEFQNPEFLSESIKLISICYDELNEVDQLFDYLTMLLKENPRISVMSILAERIRQWKGDKVAVQFTANYVRQYPSLQGLYLIISFYINSIEGHVKEDLHLLLNVVKNILNEKPEYQCNSCGFSGNVLHWHCPGCKQWGTISPFYTIKYGIPYLNSAYDGLDRSS